MSFEKTLGAARKGDIDSLKQCLEENSDTINHQDDGGRTPLYMAVGTGNVAMVEMLIKKGADVNVGNNYGTTPLHLACVKGHTDIVKVLLEQSTVDVNVVKKDGYTPLHLAVLWQHYNVVALMLSQGHQVQMEKKNSRQQTPFLLAVSGGDFELIHTLVSKGADINAVGADGNNCLHLALGRKKFHSRREYLDVLDEFCSTLGLSKEDSLSPKVVASYLAGQGANLYHTNQNNKTPLDLIGDPVFKEKLVFFSPQVKCMLCDENHATVNFHPCGHKVTCEECCSKIKLKKCPQCRQPITRKSGFESPSDTELLHEQVAQHLRIESHQAETQKLEERDLMKIAMKLGSKWWQVGIFLGIEHIHLDVIKCDFPLHTEEQSFRMLKKWFNSCGPDKCTVDMLRKALKEAECFRAIDTLPPNKM